MANLEAIFESFLEDQRERLKPRTYRDYDEVIDLFKIYLNNYGSLYVDEKNSDKTNHFAYDENFFIKTFGVERITDSTYSEFFEYFIIRKVASGESFMKKAVRVIKKFTNWLYDNNYIDQTKHENLMAYFKDGKTKALPNAEKVSDLIYEMASPIIDEDYEDIIEGYFTIFDIQPGKLFLGEVLGSEPTIGPVLVTKQISDLCQKGWDLYLMIGKYQGEWHIIESGNVYPN